MVLGHNQHVLPVIAGQGDQIGIVGQRFGGDADLGRFFLQHARDLIRRALVQADLHLGIALAQLGDAQRQHVARLRVGGRDAQATAVLRAELFPDALEVGYFALDDLDAGQNVLARLGHVLEALAMAREDVHAQLLLKLDDGLGDARLRGEKRLGGFGEVEVAANRLLDEAELMEVHDARRGKRPALVVMGDII